MQTSLRQLDQAFALVAASHQQLADYFWGDWDKSFKGPRTQKYPVLVVNIPPPVVFERVITVLPINIIVADQVKQDDSNLKEVESDTLQILHDIHQLIRSAPNWNAFGVIKTANVPIKFRDKSPDETAGWQLTINLKMIDNRGLCDLPFEGYDFNKPITSPV